MKENVTHDLVLPWNSMLMLLTL